MELRALSDVERAIWKNMRESGSGPSSLRGLMDEETFDLLCEICGAAAEDDFEAMHAYIHSDMAFTTYCEQNQAFKDTLKRAYEHAIACGDAGSCCNLANMCHDAGNGGGEADYARAIELYQLGADRGDEQSSVNLGYIYYYGRGTEVDYRRAYECFAQPALLSNHPEALWKLGDLYAAGKGVAKSDWVAWQLYAKAYQTAGESSFGARAAHHLADYMLTGIEGKLEPDPEAALHLYVEAELGYYNLIDEGLVYYSRQLEQVIEAQSHARAAIWEKHRRIRAGEGLQG